MGEIFCTIIGLLFIFGSISIFARLITEKHYEHPVRHSVIDNELEDVKIADELFMDEEELDVT